VSQPPIAGVHDEVSNRPGFVIEEKILHMTDLTIGRLDVMAGHGFAAAQMGIGSLLRCLRFRRPLGHARLHGTR